MNPGDRSSCITRLVNSNAAVIVRRPADFKIVVVLPSFRTREVCEIRNGGDNFAACSVDQIIFDVIGIYIAEFLRTVRWNFGFRSHASRRVVLNSPGQYIGAIVSYCLWEPFEVSLAKGDGQTQQPERANHEPNFDTYPRSLLRSCGRVDTLSRRFLLQFQR